MNDIYRRLARKLDELPHGFPATEDGLELRILAKIFTPEDAEVALDLLPMPESVEAIAGRRKRGVEETRAQLEKMTARGQIARFRIRGRDRYLLAPFVIGIWEFQLPYVDAELATLFEEYAPQLLRTLGGSKPALARVVPVNARVEGKAEVLRTDNVRSLIERARSFRLMDCLCRTERALVGSPCSHPLETCMAFSPEPDAYVDSPLGGRTVSREEALEVLEACEQEGLVHCTYNLQRQNMFVCNCCSCCCGFLRGINEHGAPHLLAHSDWVAAIDPEVCAACGLCADSRCPTAAIVDEEGDYRVEASRCIGCGVCTVTCPSGALEMQLRPARERVKPPATLASWGVRRAVSRSGPLRAAGQVGRLALAAARSRRLSRKARD